MASRMTANDREAILVPRRKCVQCGEESRERDMYYAAGHPLPGHERDERFFYCNVACMQAKVRDDQINTRPCRQCGQWVRRPKGTTGPIPSYCDRSCREAHQRVIYRALRDAATGAVPDVGDSASVAQLDKAHEQIQTMISDLEAALAWWQSIHGRRAKRTDKVPADLVEPPRRAQADPARMHKVLAERCGELAAQRNRIAHLMGNAARGEGLANWSGNVRSAVKAQRKARDDFASAIAAETG